MKNKEERIEFKRVNNKDKYYKFVELNIPYRNGKCFIENEILISDKKINLNATDRKEIGGFCISDYEHIFRWVIRGSYLCEVIIPEESIIYKTDSDNGIYISEKIILVNPIKMNDEIALELYNHSKLNDISYFRALAACTAQGYINTAKTIIKDKININNVNIALEEFYSFCKAREEEYNIEVSKLENVKLILYELENIKGV